MGKFSVLIGTTPELGSPEKKGTDMFTLMIKFEDKMAKTSVDPAGAMPGIVEIADFGRFAHLRASDPKDAKLNAPEDADGRWTD